MIEGVFQTPAVRRGIWGFIQHYPCLCRSHCHELLAL